jgi:hypothetical protein
VTVYDPAVRAASGLVRSFVLAAALGAVAVAAPAAAGPPSSPPGSPGQASTVVTVALKPLATGKGLALYGQPVATEIARALRAGHLDVVVLSEGVPVPSRARLVVDGHIEAGDHGAITLQVRVRDPARGVDVATVTTTAPALTAIDRATADLSARLLPAVTEQLRVQDQARARAADRARHPPDHGAPDHGHAPDRGHAAAPARLPPAVVFASSRVTSFPEAVASALAARVVARAGHRAEDGALPLGKPIPADFGLSLEVTSFAVEPHGVLTARATARVRVVSSRGRVLVDRVVHTDTLVGSRTDDRDAMARHCAAQLADILGPRVAAWVRSAP